ncbi:DUF5765 domain-containing protein [Halovulum sp. GXIMD14794]
MCWSASASVGMVVIGSAATAVTVMRGERPAIWGTLAYFTLMEALQSTGYAVVDECGTAANRNITLLSYLHICFQPIVINAFAMAVAPREVPRATRRWVWALSGLATAMLLLRLVPLEALGRCAIGDPLCGDAICLTSGNWHIAWQLPLNDLPAVLGLPGEFPFYLAAVFALPLIYGAWRLVLFHAVAGPILAMMLTDDPNEMPAIWCLFSIGLVLIAMSPFVRQTVMHAPFPARA